MISGEAKVARCVMGRFEAGEEVVESLVALARFEKIDAGFVRGNGVVEDVRLERWDAARRAYVPLASVGSVDGPWELVSLQGNLSLQDGVPVVRVWAVVAAELGGRPQLLGGFLGSARAVFVELAVDVWDDGDLERRPGPALGLPLWRTPRRR